MSYDPVTEETELQCFRGICELENEHGALVIRDEQKTVVKVSAAPEPPVEMTIEETQEFVELPEAKTGEIEIPAVDPNAATEVTEFTISATPEPGPTATPAPEPTATPVPTPTPEPTATPLPTPRPTATMTPTPTPKPR